MDYRRPLDYRALWQSWWQVPVKLTAGIAATLFAGLSFLQTQRCYGCPPLVADEALSLTLLIAGGIGVVGLAFGIGGNANAKATVGQAFGVAYLSDHHELTRRVHGLSDQLGLPRPAVGIMSAANAFAVGSSPEDGAVILGRPLIHLLDEDELDAVIGHELGHIATGDMQKMQIAVGYQRMFDVVFQVIGIILQIGLMIAASASRDSRHARDAQAGLGMAYGLTALGRFTVAIGSELMVKGMSRSREYYADAVGAHLTSPEAMEGALVKIHGLGGRICDDEHRFGAFMFRSAAGGHWFSTHPTLAARRRALRTGGYLRALHAQAEAGPHHRLKVAAGVSAELGQLAAALALSGARLVWDGLTRPWLWRTLACIAVFAVLIWGAFTGVQAVWPSAQTMTAARPAPKPSLNALGPLRRAEKPTRGRKAARLAGKGPRRGTRIAAQALITRRTRLTIARKGRAPQEAGWTASITRK